MINLELLYQDPDLLVIDKPAGIIVFPEGPTKEKALIDYLLEKYPELTGLGDPPRYGIVHRLDKDTSGILLIARNNESLIFLQKQFKNRRVEKKYICLVKGAIKEDTSEIKTLIGRSPSDKRKQKVYLAGEPGSEGKREAITEYKVLKRYEKYTLLEVQIKTGRRHQIRCHLAYIQHPIVGDKMYGFKKSPVPQGLTRQFLHASYLRIQLPNGKTQEFISNLPDELKIVINNLEPIE